LDPETAAIYEQLRRAYFRALPHRLEALTLACSRAPTLTSKERAEAREEAHQIGGSSLIFGAGALSREALGLEDVLASRAEGEPWLQALDAQLERFVRAVEELSNTNETLHAGFLDELSGHEPARAPSH
jgi:HPt (histidine-containing phosphotransfer) domain-containing protein